MNTPDIQLAVPPELVLGEYCNYIRIHQDGSEILVDLVLANTTVGVGELLFRMRCTPVLLGNFHTFLGRALKRDQGPTLDLVDTPEGHKTVVVRSAPDKGDPES